MKERETTVWYESIGWAILNRWITELKARGLTTIYIENLGVIPTGMDKKTICKCFNADAGNGWSLKLEDDGSLLISQYLH